MLDKIYSLDTNKIVNPLTSIYSEVTTIPPFLLEKYIPSLDGFRAFSIILVIISHLSFNFQNSVLFKLELGGFGVSIFFVISGFLITLLLLKEKSKYGKISLSNFYVRRFLRILPVAYLFILVLILLNNFLSLHISYEYFIPPIFFVKNFFPITFWSVDHYWSLSVEEQFYLIFPFILSYSFKKYIKITFSLIFLIPLISYIYYHNSF
ncbi:acyltransferase family protein, partial [Mucilaginibacter sp.]